jgi:multidrug efflux system membrane fusion protein
MDRNILTPPERQDDRIAGEQARQPRLRWRRRWVWFALIVLIAIVAYIVFRRPSNTQNAGARPGAGGPRGAMVIPVVAAKAEQGDIGVYYTGLGSVTPIYTVTVKTRVDGQLMNVHYKEGQSVRKGELLAQIDPRPFQVQLTQAEGQLLKDEAALENARVDLARYETLLPKNAIPEQQVATQKALIAQDQGAVKTDQGNIDNANLNLVYCRIIAPITGRIGLRLVDPGNIVHATDANGLMVITQVEPISVIFTISEDQVPPVAAAMHAGRKLEVDAYDREMKNRISQGTLATLDNQIDQSTGTLRLRAIFNNKDGALFPNQFVNARMLVEEKRGVTLVPTAAIQRNSQMAYVYLVKPDQTVTVRPVNVGTTEGERTEVASGLSSGDVVVTSGVDKLQEGTKVAVHFPGEGGQKAGQ